MKYRLSLIATIFAIIVVGLGAYTRLTNGGLGCPDWPGCYGHIVVPHTNLPQTQFNNAIVEPQKAWAEMVHRYCVGILSLMVIFLIGQAIVLRKRSHYSLALPLALSALFIFQAVLGMWTVTWKLYPLVVMGHLLGGISVAACLWIMTLRARSQTKAINWMQLSDQQFRFWAFLGFIIVFAQVALGGWTSSNYAALACPDFPSCHGQLFPNFDWQHALHALNPIGPNYEGGTLDSAARETIHFMHRLGALITTLYLTWLSCWILLSAQTRLLKNIGAFILFVLTCQISLGVLNVVWLLPLPIAVMHNLVGAVLLLTLVTLNFALHQRPQLRMAY